MAQSPISKLTRQQRRAHERAMMRQTMSKLERRSYFRMPTPVKKEIYQATMELLARNSPLVNQNSPTTTTSSDTQPELPRRERRNIEKANLRKNRNTTKK